MLEITFRAMGCQMKAVVDADNPVAEATLRQVPAWFEEWEAKLSRFRPDSELCHVNARGGGWQRVSNTMLAVTAAALRAAGLTGGLVDPTVLPALEFAGYDRGFELGLGQGPVREAPDGIPAGMWSAVKIDEADSRIWLPPDVRIDLGGIAKGWAADQAANRLSRLGPALVDAGGDIAVRGPRRDGHPWAIDIDGLGDEAGEPLGLLVVEDGFVATSGRDRRRWSGPAGDQHHLIDPRTAAPSRSDVVRSTVIAADGLQAEAAAKASLLLGHSLGLGWLHGQPATEGLLIGDHGQAWASRGWDAFVWKG
jgi:thiamine biosynthesis lipoprotein